MASQLNIKSEDGYRLATALSALTGESLTTAVTAALRERLDREQHTRDRDAKRARLLGLAIELRASLRHAGPLPQDPLYDTTGLPG
jgi:antitoxin VapB